MFTLGWDSGAGNLWLDLAKSCNKKIKIIPTLEKNLAWLSAVETDDLKSYTLFIIKLIKILLDGLSFVEK